MTDPAEARVAELEAAVRELRLAFSESRITMFTLEVAPSGDLAESRVEITNLWESLGYDEPPAPTDHVATSGWLHPDDRVVFDGLLHACIAGERDRFELELRANHRDGSEVWHLVRAAAMRDARAGKLRVVGTGIDITQLKATERELRTVKQVAEAANQSKDEFLSNVSHEIRTPMNAILGMTDLVLDTTLAEQQRRSLLTVRSAARELLDIINDLLDFSKIQAGQTTLDEGPFGLRAALGDTMRALATRAHRKGLELVYDVSSDVPDSLVGDVGRIRQVMLNLVGNAIKFTERGEVVVNIELDEAVAGERVALKLSVKDTGIGIAESKFDAIFRAFEQEDMSTTRRYGGTGLGLTIASRLVTLMRGAITLESKVGHGSTFTSTMIVALGPVTEDRPVAVAEILRGLRVLVVDDKAVNRRILVAEDNEFNADLLLQLLRKQNYEVTLARGGAQAIALLEAERFDALVLDLHMPEVDGFQVVRSLREREQGTGKHVPVIALTARARKEDRERCLAAGMDEFVSKPVEATDLWRILERLVTGTSPPSPFDAELVLATCGGDPEILARMIARFIALAPNDLAAMRTALAAGDDAALAIAAHKAKSMFGAFSAAASAASTDIEEAAERKDLASAYGPLDRLGALIEELIRAAPRLSVEELQRQASHRDENRVEPVRR